MNLEPTRFLIVRLSAIGDVLHATTVAHNLRLARPDCHITWLASPPASELLRYNPDIDELLIWDRRLFDHAVAHAHLLAARQEMNKLRRLFAVRHFDVVLDVQCLFLTGVISRMAHAEKRIGIHERHEFNHLFMTARGPKIQIRHKIHHYLTVLHPLGIEAKDYRLILQLPPELDTFAERFFAAHAIDAARPILMVNPRTTWPDKNWPPAFFPKALNTLPEDIQIIFCGAKADIACIRQIRTVLTRPSLSIAGETNLLELAALFRQSSLLLTGDTGPLYIAAAAGLSTLSLWGPTHPDIYGPLEGEHHFILSPHSCTACCKTRCQQGTNACMNAISPDIVEKALKSFFQRI